MPLFLTDNTMRDIGVALGQKFTEGELNELQDLLRHGASVCKAIHASNTDETAANLTKLADAIEAGEKFGREDHDLQPNPSVEKAERLRDLLNAGVAPRDALGQLDIDPEDVSTEDDLAVDDPDNTVIDLFYDEHGVCAYVQRHGDRWYVHTVTKEN